jgi:hypothetical protein
MPLLYFWRGDNYRRDLDYGAGYHLNQSNPLLHAIAEGDSLWAFTRSPDGRYALAAEIVVSAKTLNSSGFRYGKYRVWGDLRQSRYFAVHGQPDITTLIQGTSVRAKGSVLGRAFQGNAAVRRLTNEDHAILAAYAAQIPLEPRARLLPEERLEALILSGDEDAVGRLLQEEPSGLAESRRAYLYSEARRRSKQHIETLRDLYQGQCQICAWAPRSTYSTELCEAHHIRWLSRGGGDAISNMVLICPNHHRAIHATDAAFDFGLNGFIFAGREEKLRLQHHELVAG